MRGNCAAGGHRLKEAGIGSARRMPVEVEPAVGAKAVEQGSVKLATQQAHIGQSLKGAALRVVKGPYDDHRYMLAQRFRCHLHMVLGNEARDN